MSIFTVVLLCIQTCLIKNALGYCSSRAGLVSATPVPTLAPGGYGAALVPAAAYAPQAYAPSAITNRPATAAYSSAADICSAAAYGGTGEGNVAVFGELPITGETAFTGQVPVTGVVSFGGAVPAAGGVSISGNCACGCSSIY